MDVDAGKGTPPTITTAAENLEKLKVAKLFRTHNENNAPYTSLSFDDKGEYLITTGEDETLQLFSARAGKHVKQAFSKKYGCNLARFTHKSSTVVHASTKGDDTIRYLSLHDNTYIRYFRGHKRRVTSLEMSPSDDTVISGSLDDTVRLWDLRSPTCQGLMNIAGQPAVAFDPTGQVFAVALNIKPVIMLYDVRNFDSEPFAAETISVPLHLCPDRKPPVFTSIKFSNDGRRLLACSAGDLQCVLDGFSLNLRASLTGHQGLDKLDPQPTGNAPPLRQSIHSSEEMCWSPDGQSVLGGGADGKVNMWEIESPNGMSFDHGFDTTIAPRKTFEGHMGSACRAVAFNPRFAMLATAGDQLAFWQPDVKSGGAAVEEGKAD